MDKVFVEILWHANPFRGDKFAKVWEPAAEAALDYGASYWALLRAHEGGQDFIPVSYTHLTLPTTPYV